MLSEILKPLLSHAREKGADEADLLLLEDHETSVSCRMQKVERAESSILRDLGIRVIVGKKQAVVSSSAVSLEEGKKMVERALDMARVSTDDPWCGLPEALEAPEGISTLDLEDKTKFNVDHLIEMAMRAEKAALDVDGITNSDGADASHGRVQFWLMNSRGFEGSYSQSYTSFSASVIGGEGTHMERDYDYAAKVHAADLPAPEEIGRKAAENTLARLNPRKVKSGEFPVIFDPRVGNELIRALARGINGNAVVRKTSFLQDEMGQRLFRPEVQIIDDARLKRGLSSKPFDAEGMKTGRLSVIENGHLQTWILDSATARQLNLKSTARASRSTSSPPGPAVTNFYMQAGKVSFEDLVSDIPSGFYVTETMGMGANIVTGDYSQGASGFWIENGKIAYPVNEITIAGHLKEMFAEMIPANDLEFKGSVNLPSVLVPKMTVAGI